MKFTDAEVMAIIKGACEANGSPDIADRIYFRWSNRMTSSMGNCRHKRDCTFYDLTFSVKLFERADKLECENTIVHETCHAIDSILNNTRMSHGYSWQRVMRNAGIAPERCHNISNAGLIKRYVYTCSCGTPHNVSTRKHNSIQKFNNYRCKNCRSYLTFTGEIIGVDNTI